MALPRRLFYSCLGRLSKHTCPAKLIYVRMTNMAQLPPYGKAKAGWPESLLVKVSLRKKYKTSVQINVG